MSLFRCRQCQEVTSVPLEHSLTHGDRSTLAQVWEGFSLVAGKTSQYVDVRIPNTPGQETYPIDA